VNIDEFTGKSLIVSLWHYPSDEELVKNLYCKFTGESLSVKEFWESFQSWRHDCHEFGVVLFRSTVYTA